MAEKKPSRRSQTKSSPEPSKAGSARPRATRLPTRRSAQPIDEATLVARVERGDFPGSLYVDGPDESLKAAILAELRHAWARVCPEAPHPRVFRAVEDGVEAILSAYHGTSLFTPRELLIVLDLEGVARSERAVLAFAEGVARPAGGSCLVLSESASETPRKSLEPLRAACDARWTAMPLGRRALIDWGQRRAAREQVSVEDGVLDGLADSCEDNPSEFFNELEKLLTCAGAAGRITRADAAALLRPVAGADLIDYLAAVAAGDAALAARRLGRVLAAGEGEGSVLFALANLVGGAIGGWARRPELSVALARRSAPGTLARALDALYRGEAAWKRGRADAVAVLEQATREVCGAGATARV